MINLIAAIAKNGVIGNKSKMPWNIPEEFNLFQKITQDAVIIMGRKTYATIGRGMLNRKNIVLSKTKTALPGVEVCTTIAESIAKAESYGQNIFVIGGSEIYQQFFPFADKMYLSHLKKEYAGDTYFPKFNKEQWKIESKKDYLDFELIIYQRKTKKPKC